MAGNLSNYLENKLLDHFLATTSYTAPSNVYVALMTVAEDDTGTAGTEVSGGSYARQTATFDAAAAVQRRIVRILISLICLLALLLVSLSMMLQLLAICLFTVLLLLIKVLTLVILCVLLLVILTLALTNWRSDGKKGICWCGSRNNDYGCFV